ncbi:MAG: YceI family protein [Asticcacaulis sp.]|uniref:YceI family protein n=1 Tax=Asticcacaulis sp. TaxID=1872648 RepID=UPI0039E4DD1D
MKRLLITCTVLSLCALNLAACTPKKADQPAAESVSASASAAPSVANIPAGDYKTDPAHTSLTFGVDHLSYSHYTAHFTKIDAQLKLDPAHPETATLSATIDPQSLELNSPPKGFHDEMMGKMFFDAASFPKITYTSTKIDMTGANTARVTGDLTLHGVTRPVTLYVTFNGGYPGLAGMDPNARIGFSAKGKLKRSLFGMGYGVPAPGTTMGVGDDVDFSIETEMTGPALKTAEK